MNRFRKRFGRYAVLPVIHLLSSVQAVDMAAIAVHAGAQGVFLINHHQMDDHAIVQIASDIRRVFSDLWIGANFLSMANKEAIELIPQQLNGWWTDDSRVDERLGENDAQKLPDEIASIRKDRHWDGIYFGGTAFKYQRTVLELEKAAQYATKYMDVVTTSGDGTGIAADIDKIRRMKTALRTDEYEDYPLAIASGITPENIKHYLPFADAFLVSTGICLNSGVGDDFFRFDPQKVERLVASVKSNP